MNDRKKEVVDRELSKIASDLVMAMEPPLTREGVAFVLILVDDTGRHVVRSNVLRGSVSEVLEAALHAVKTRGFKE